MPKGRPPKRHHKRLLAAEKRDSSSCSSPSDMDDTGLRRSTRKRRVSAYQEDDITQVSKKRKDDDQTFEDADSDQIESETDEAGEKKIDKHGNLQDGRVFKVPTFTLPTRGETVLMLAMDPAKTLGYRDSHIFFNKNPTLERVRLEEDEKDILVERNMVLSWFRHRDVAVVTARSVFKRFGAKIIKKGKRCRDDYFEAKAREQGYTGETTTVEKKTELMALGDDLSSGFDHHDDTFSQSRRSLLNSNGSKEDDADDADYTTYTRLTHQTWLHHLALGARGFNAQLKSCRDRKAVFYDVHTNINQVPSATQPSRCQWVSITKSDTAARGPAVVKNSTVEQQESEVKVIFDNIPTDTTQTIDYGHTFSNQHDIENILASLPQHVRTAAASVLKKSYSAYCSDADHNDNTYPEYPIALMEQQYQDEFPLHFTRFGTVRPYIQGPTAVIGKTQSMMAQQYYLNQVYQYINYTKNLPQGNQVYAPSTMPPQPTPGSNLTPSAPFQGQPDTTSHKQRVQRRKEESQSNENIPEVKAKASIESTSANLCTECHQIGAPAKLLKANEDEYPCCDPFSMVACSKCHQKYHPVCANLTTPKQLASIESYPWSCPECKICCVCHSAGDETKLMICDGCDRGWHTDCCSPPVADIPEGSWLCPLCAVCHSCDTINAPRAHSSTGEDLIHAVAPPTNNYKFPIYIASYCDACFTNFEEDRFCPVCLRSYADGDDVAEDDKEMVACDTCDRWVHSRCDDTLTEERYEQLCEDENAKYTCPLCAKRVQVINPDSSLALMAVQGLTAPCGSSIGVIGGKVKTRGFVEYKDYNVGVPEIHGAGSTELSMPS